MMSMQDVQNPKEDEPRITQAMIMVLISISDMRKAGEESITFRKLGEKTGMKINYLSKIIKNLQNGNYVKVEEREHDLKKEIKLTHLGSLFARISKIPYLIPLAINLAKDSDVQEMTKLIDDAENKIKNWKKPSDKDEKN